MIDERLLTDPTRCPSCTAHLVRSASAPSERCAECQVLLTGPDAAEAWAASVEAAAALGRRRAAVDRMRAAAASLAPAAAPLDRHRDAEAAPAPVRRRREVRALQVRTVLLALGVLLLVVAALVFTVVAWGRFGLGGRAAVLGTLTAAAAWASSRTARAGLRGTAEGLALLTVALGLLDAAALRLAGVADGTDANVYAALATGVTAAVAAAAGWRSRVRLTAPRLAAASLAQLPLPLLLPTLADDPAEVAWTLLLQAALAAATLALLSRDRDGAPRALLGAGAVVAASCAVGCGLLAALAPWLQDGPQVAVGLAGAGALAGVALLAAWSAGRHGSLRPLLVGVAAALLLLAGWAALVATGQVGPRWATTAAAAVLLAGAGALLLGARTLAPADVRASAAAVLAGGVPVVAVAAAPVALAVLGPVTWWAAGPAAGPRSGAADLVAPGTGWPDGVGAALVALAALAPVLAALAGLSGRPRRAAAAAGAPLLAAAATLPPLLDLPLAGAVAAWAVAGGLALALAVVRPSAHRPLATGAAVALGVALSWAQAAEGLAVATAALVLAAAVLAVALLPAGARPAGAASTVLVAAVLAHRAVTYTDATSEAAAASAGAAALVVLLLGSLPGVRRHLGRTGHSASAGSATLVVLAALVGTSSDQLWTAHLLVASGLSAAVLALLRGLGALRWLSGALLTAASWLRLDLAGVETVEAYSLPPALVLLAVGVVRRRREPSVTSWSAYGAGLAGATLPTLALVLTTDDPRRSLLLGGAALALTLAGAARRQQAPLAVGALVLGVVTVVQLLPYADALPRWVALAVAGLVLLGAGATYERRVRDVRRVTQRFAALG